MPGPPPHRPNDLCLGPDGLLYFTDPHDWENLPNLGVGRVNRTTLDGRVERLCDVPNFPNGIAFGPDDRLYAAGSLGDVLVVFEPDGRVARTIEMGAGSEPTNCCLGDGRLYVTLAGTGELVALDLGVEPLPLYPARN